MKKFLLIVLAFCTQALQAQICISATHYTLSVSGSGYSTTSADFNNDGFNDLAISNVASYNQISILLNNGNGHFATPYTYTYTSIGKLISADFNNDNNQDIAMLFTDSL